MCLGVPGRVVALDIGTDGMPSAIVEFGALRRRICVACVPDVQPGEYVIVHAGIAINRLDAAEADRLLAHLREMDELDSAEEDRTAGARP